MRAMPGPNAIPISLCFHASPKGKRKKKEKSNSLRRPAIAKDVECKEKNPEPGQLGDRHCCGRKFVPSLAPYPLERGGGGFHLWSPVFEDRSGCSVAGWHSSTTNPGRLDHTHELAPRVIECPGALTRRYEDGRGPRRGRRAVTGLGRVMRTSLGRSIDSRSSRQS